MGAFSEERLLAKAILEQIPHLKNTDPEAINSWLTAVESADPTRLVFHAKRVANWGGSELGTLVQTLRNLSAEYANQLGFSHQSIEDLVQSKLLLRTPEPPNGPTLRGSLIEPYVCEMYIHHLKQTYTNVVVRDDIAERMRNSGLMQNHFGIRMDPDFVVEVDGKRVLVDFKAPSEKTLRSAIYDDPLSYRCQLNAGYEIARKMEVPYEFDQLMLVVYNHEKGALEEIIIDIDEPLIEEIYEATNYFTPFVLRGEVPSSRINHLEIISQNDLPDELVSEISKHSVLKLALQGITDMLLESEAKIGNYTKPMQAAFHENFQCKIGPAIFRGQEKLEFNKQACYEALIEALPTEQHVDLACIKNNSTKLLKLAKQHFTEREIGSFYSTTYEIKHALTTAQKGLQSDLKSDIKTVLGDNISALVGDTLDILDAENGVLTEQVARSQYWDLRNLVKVFDNYREDDAISGKARVLLEERVGGYARSAEVALATAVPGVDDTLIDNNIQLQGLIAKIINDVIEPSNQHVSTKARELEAQAEKQRPKVKAEVVDTPKSAKSTYRMNVMNFS